MMGLRPNGTWNWGRLATALLIGTFAAAGCLEGGVNQNERTAGGGDEGADLRFGQIAVDPRGQYMLSRHDGEVLHVSLDDGEPSILPGLRNPGRIAFAHASATLFVTRDTRNQPSVSRYNVGQRSVAWKTKLPGRHSESIEDFEFAAAPQVQVTEDDAYLVVTTSERVFVLEPDDGSIVHELEIESVRDVDITPDQRRLVITGPEQWEDGEVSTRLTLLKLATGSTSRIRVPNCTSELVLDPKGRYAYLAPTFCIDPEGVEKDPVSVIDLSTGEFVRNLPGFGPVAMAARGTVAVAFMDMDNLDLSLFEDEDEVPKRGDSRYRLMFIDTRTQRFNTIAIGDVLPRYALTPDGEMLLVDDGSWFQESRVRLVNVQSRSLVTLRGPKVSLDIYAMTSNSRRVFIVDHGLFQVKLSKRRIDSVPLDFVPTDLNLTPDDSLLLLRQGNAKLHLLDAKTFETVRTIKL